MNLFNRIVVILLLLAGMVLLPVFFIFPEGVIRTVQVNLSALSSTLLVINPTVRLAGGFALAALSFLLCLILLILEFTRFKPKAVRVSKISGGEALLELGSVADRLRYNVSQLPEVIEARPRVSARGKGVAVELDLQTAPDINVPAKTEEVYEIVRSTVEEQMGLKLSRIKVNIKHARKPMPLTQ